MISISSAIYGFLLQQVRTLIKDDGCEQCTYTLQSEPDEVYLRFGGGSPKAFLFFFVGLIVTALLGSPTVACVSYVR